MVSLVLFVLLEILSCSMLSRSESLQNLWVKRFPRRVQSVLWSGGESLRNFASLKSENEILSQQNAALAEELRILREAGIEKSLSIPEKERSSEYSYLPARIVRMSRGGQHNYIVLDRGSSDGVRPLSGIITGRGIVGIVDAVEDHYSYGITLMNTSATLSARVGREGIVAPLVWDGIHTDRAVLRDLPIHYPVAQGDTIWTSGFSSIFPAGIPVGTVTGTKMRGGSTNEARVVLFQDFATLRNVTIVWNPEKDAIKKLIEKEEGND